MLIALAAIAALCALLVLGAGCALAFRLLRLHGRMLAHIESLEAALVAPVRSAVAPGLPPSAPQSAAPQSPDPPSPAPVAVAEAQAVSDPAAPLTPRRPLAAGTPAPEFVLPEIQGGRVALSQLVGRRLLLIFFHPGCDLGTRLVPDLLYCSRDGFDGRPLPIVIGEGGVEQVSPLFRDNGVRTPVFHDADGAVAAAYGVDSTPVGYQVDESGWIAGELLLGVDAILALLRPDRALGNLAAQQPLQPGVPAPSFHLPRLGGGELTLEQFRGARLLLVFVDPFCAPCHAIAPELEALHRTSAHTRVALVGRGGDAAMQAMVAECGVSLPVGLQQHWEISRAFGSLSTPLGFVLDERGVVAQPAHSGLAALRAALPELR